MLKKESEERQENLTKVVYELSDNLCVNDGDLRATAIQLKTIYSGKWRHRYSEFFAIILDIADEGNHHSTDILSENLEKLREFIETDYIAGAKEFTSLYYNFTKLSDHLNLEIGRLNHYTSNIQATADIKAKFDYIQTVVDNVEKNYRRMKKRLKIVRKMLINYKCQLSRLLVYFQQ